MKKDKVSVKIVPDSRRIKNGFRLSLKLRITYKGDRKYYAAGLDASAQEWRIINSPDVRSKLQKIRIEMGDIEKKALECVDKISPFSFVTFERDFFKEAPVEVTLEAAFNACIGELKANDQFGTAKSYQDACNAMKRFRPGNLRFEDITKEFLNDFEKWMLGNKKALSTIGIYLRPLRTVFNIAIERGLVRQDAYPFGRRK